MVLKSKDGFTRKGKEYEYPVKGSFTPVQGPLRGTWANISGINGT